MDHWRKAGDIMEAQNYTSGVAGFPNHEPYKFLDKRRRAKIRNIIDIMCDWLAAPVGGGAVRGEGKHQLLMIPVWKWFCNWKPPVRLPQYSRTVFTPSLWGSSWRARAKCSVWGRAPASFFFYMASSISFIYSLIYYRWLNRLLNWIQYLASTYMFFDLLWERIALSPLLMVVFVCIRTATSDEKEPRPKNT